MSEINSVLGVLEGHTKTECVVVARCFFLHGVLVITYVLSGPDPSFTELLSVNN